VDQDDKLAETDTRGRAATSQI